MKNLFKIIVLIALATSCAKETGNESIPEASRKYNLSFVEATKTELTGSERKRQVKWNEGDAIKYYTASNQSSPVTASVNLEGDNAYITIPRGRADEFINAVYGASQLSSASSTESALYISSPVKDNQSYTSFSQAHLCAAFSDDIEKPNLSFHNAAAIFKFFSSAKVSKIVFYGNNGETITGGSTGALKISHASGTLTVETSSTGGCSVTVQTGGQETDFYMAILPVNFEGGITVDCYDSNMELIATQKTTNAINTVSSSGATKVLDLGSVQNWLNNSLPVAIDLGLSVKWSRVNLGAIEPEDYGDYFSWGETAPKSAYNWSDYSFGVSKNGPFSRYVLNADFGTVDHKTVLALDDDAAHVILGGDWRLPSKEEVDELMSNCSWLWTTRNGVPGYQVTSNKDGFSGVSIFLPANGMIGGSSPSDVGIVGNYWSSSISADGPYFAMSPYFSQSGKENGNCYRYFGLGIRPVEGAVVPVSSIEVPASLELIIGRTEMLSATVSPDNATYKNVTWSSSDESVATVDDNGKVTAVSIGTANVTLYSADASKTASCEVTVTEPLMVDGYEYVDLGLPSGLKWATCNVGASSPEDYGDFFAWGETEPKSTYNWSTYKWCNGAYNKLTKYCTDSSFWDSSDPMDNKTFRDLEDDAARAIWGGTWRIPTDAEWTELRENCTWTWTNDYKGTGIAGTIITSDMTGYENKSIFLPAAGGWTGGTGLDTPGWNGNYWSSSLYTDHPSYAWGIYFYLDAVERVDNYRCRGFSVRPVSGQLIESISLNKTQLLIYKGDYPTPLTATVLPDDAINKYLTWSSFDTSVATVATDGKVTAVSPGTTIITAMSNDGSNVSTECIVTVEINLSKPDSVEAVDLSLPSGLKWASCNVGAFRPEAYGEHFAWGETDPKSIYNWATYKWCTGIYNSLTKYCPSDQTNKWGGSNPPDDKTVLDAEDDAARVNWGGNWRMPTDEDWTELRENCTWTWTNDYKESGVAGSIVSAGNGNSVFFPAAGDWGGTSFNRAGSDGFYWSSTLPSGSPNIAWDVEFNSSHDARASSYRCYGLSVRPVTE